MAPVARKLASIHGVLEPIQTAMTLDGQIDELHMLLERQGALPLTLVGYSNRESPIRFSSVIANRAGNCFQPRYPSSRL